MSAMLGPVLTAPRPTLSRRKFQTKAVVATAVSLRSLAAVGAVGVPVKLGDASFANPLVMFWNASAVVPRTIVPSVTSCQTLSA